MLLEDDRSDGLKKFSKKIVDKIYDDFEEVFKSQADRINELELESMNSRTCENCKHYKAENKQCVNESSIAFTSQEAICYDDGCNKWEQK